MESPSEYLVSQFLRIIASDFEKAVAQGEVDPATTSLDDALDAYFANWGEDLTEGDLRI